MYICIDGLKAHEKVVIITEYKKNTNQNMRQNTGENGLLSKRLEMTNINRRDDLKKDGTAI